MLCFFVCHFHIATKSQFKKYFTKYFIRKNDRPSTDNSKTEREEEKKWEN